MSANTCSPTFFTIRALLRLPSGVGPGLPASAPDQNYSGANRFLAPLMRSSFGGEELVLSEPPPAFAGLRPGQLWCVWGAASTGKTQRIQQQLQAAVSEGYIVTVLDPFQEYRALVAAAGGTHACVKALPVLAAARYSELSAASAISLDFRNGDSDLSDTQAAHLWQGLYPLLTHRVGPGRLLIVEAWEYWSRLLGDRSTLLEEFLVQARAAKTIVVTTSRTLGAIEGVTAVYEATRIDCFEEPLPVKEKSPAL